MVIGALTVISLEAVLAGWACMKLFGLRLRAASGLWSLALLDKAPSASMQQRFCRSGCPLPHAAAGTRHG
ncbi:hypothetical protein LNP74_24790 [Klebsiella pneumoniae subsp. pneumoniae]|nr:hypothetical protein [Klebsiella pneumoniae subsp. pneumoniae]